tara:strand:- start:195 stop:956 length:762 start_codon:yes stop_codon:yes gene_type:complete
MTNLVVFNSITNFIKDLNDCFGSNHKSLQLYNRLIEKTTVAHKDAIAKHISIFKTWCTVNEKSIVEQNFKTLEGNIEYSEKCFINLRDIFNEADSQQRTSIWKHILLICAYINPNINAKEILQKEDSNEKDFLKDMITKVEENVGDTENLENPMQAVANMMSSGVFNELVGSMSSGLQNGELNLNKLMGTVNNMVTTLTNEIGDENEDTKQMNSMMSNLTNMVSNMNQNQEENESQENNEEQNQNQEETQNNK